MTDRAAIAAAVLDLMQMQQERQGRLAGHGASYADKHGEVQDSQEALKFAR